MHLFRPYTGILILLLIFSSSAHSQNLVRNCELESKHGCPTAHGQLEYCMYWYSPGDGTTDYLNSCNNGNFSVPFNQFGFQTDPGGNGYAHIIAYYPQSGQYREYMQTKLACPMLAGMEYSVGFHVSCSDDGRYAIDGIGAHFTTAPLDQPGDDVINLPGDPHILTPDGVPLDDKENWMFVSGTYVAQGGEQYMTIGNFKYNNELTLHTFTAWETRFASYYVDDVSVIAEEAMVSLGNDTTICPNDSILFDFSSICPAAELVWENGSEDLVRWIGDEGTYVLSGEIGCSDFWDAIVISHSPDPGNFLPSDSVVCFGETTEIIPAEDFDEYQWQDGSHESTYIADIEGTYWLDVINGDGCSFSDTILLSALDEPNFTLGEDILVCIGQEVLLDPGVDSAFHHFLWNDYSTGTTLITTDSGEYWVEIRNPCGMMTDYKFIHMENCNPILMAPSAFTPNGDGLNDKFQILAENISNFRMLIYDRWGSLIFESYDLEFGWDGNINGSIAPVGTYIWLAIYDIRLEDNSFETKKEKGTVVLLQ